jgi:hypothetical protein
MPAGIKFSKHGSIQATVPAAQQAGRDIEAGIDSGEGAKVPARSNTGCASACLTRMLLLCGLGRGNFNVGNNSQLTAARKRLAPSYATTVRVCRTLQSGCQHDKNSSQGSLVGLEPPTYAPVAVEYPLGFLLKRAQAQTNRASSTVMLCDVVVC